MVAAEADWKIQQICGRHRKFYFWVCIEMRVVTYQHDVGVSPGPNLPLYPNQQLFPSCEAAY